MSQILRKLPKISRQLPQIVRRNTHTNKFIEEYNGLKENAYTRWTWNRKHTISVLFSVVILPAGIYYACHKALVYFYLIFYRYKKMKNVVV